MYHSLIFQRDGETGKFNTYDQWHLIPSSPPIVAMPTPKLSLVEIPGRKDYLDLSDYLTGTIPQFSDRKGTFEFYVAQSTDPLYPNKFNGTTNSYNRPAIRQSLAEYFNGRNMKMWLEDDQDYYYFGRFYLKDWKYDSGTNHIVVTIEYQLQPYRMRNDGKDGGR